MLKNYISEALELNKIDLSEEFGVKLYYSKTKNMISVMLYGLMITGSVWLIIMSISLGDNAMLIIYIGYLLLFIYAMQEAISRVLLKKPVLILSEDKLYYIKTQKWYKIDDYKFEDKLINPFSLYMSFYMEDKKQK